MEFSSEREIAEALMTYRGKTVVVKYGGAAMQSTGLRNSVIKDVMRLKKSGTDVVLVHGGGPELSALQERLGIETRFVDGLRYTDAETIDAALMALCGKVNKDIVRMIENEGGNAIGICGIDGGILRCVKKEWPDLGFVGEIKRVKTEMLHTLLIGNTIPVLSTIGLGEDGQAYNVNADTAAGRIAASLSAVSLIALSDVPGIMHDMGDPNSLIGKIHVADLEGLITAGVISGGMIPKVRGLADAVRSGVKTATITNGRIPHALIFALCAGAVIKAGRELQGAGSTVGTFIVA